jgi:beta-lactamase regulating signal transducer with metallopeptidase domain
VSFFTSIGPWFGSLIALALGGTILVGIATLLSRCLRQPVWQRAVWQMSMIGLSLLFIGDGSGLVDGAIAWSRQTLAFSRSPSTAASAEEVQPAESPGSASVSFSPSQSATSEPNTESVDLSEETSSEPTVTTTQLPRASTIWLGVLWLAGALVVAGRALFARALLVVFRRRCISFSGGALAERVSKISQQFGLRRRVRVLEAARLQSPAVFGFFRPTIALPAGFADSLSSEQQDVIVAHELAHLAAHDPAWRVFTDLVTAIWWWHPLVWWSRQQLHAASEMAADEASLLVTGGPALLATCLVELGGRMLGGRQTGWVRMSGNGFRSDLGRRVKRLLSLNNQSQRPPRRWHLAVSITLGPVLLLSAALFSTAWARPRPSDEGGSSMTMREAWRESFAGMLLCAALGTNGNAAASDDLSEPAAPQKAQPGAIAAPADNADDPQGKPNLGKADKNDVSTKIKVFRLKHLDPDEVQGILAHLLDFPRLGLVQVRFGVPFNPFEGGNGLRPGNWSGRFEAGVSLTSDVSRGQEGESPTPCHLAADSRTRSLIVRGSEKHLAIAADLVTVLDLPSDMPIPKVRNLSAYRLAHAEAVEVAQVLYRLNFRSRFAPATDKTLIVVGPEKELKEIGEVIKQLDVEGKGSKPDKKPEGGTGAGKGGGN